MKSRGRSIMSLMIVMAVIALSVTGGVYFGSKLVRMNDTPAPVIVSNETAGTSGQTEAPSSAWSDPVAESAADQNTDPVAEAAKRATQEIPPEKALLRVDTFGAYKFSDMFRQANGSERGYYDTGDTAYAYVLHGDTDFGSYGVLDGEVGGIAHPVTFSNAEHYNWLTGDLVLSADDQTMMAIDGSDQYFMQLVIIDSNGNASPIGERLCGSAAKSTRFKYYIGDLDEFTLGIHGWDGMSALTMGFEVKMECD